VVSAAASISRLGTLARTEIGGEEERRRTGLRDIATVMATVR